MSIANMLGNQVYVGRVVRWLDVDYQIVNVYLGAVTLLNLFTLREFIIR